MVASPFPSGEQVLPLAQLNTTNGAKFLPSGGSRTLRHHEKLRSKCAKEAQYRMPVLGTWIWILRFSDRFGPPPDVPPRVKAEPLALEAPVRAVPGLLHR